MRGRKKGYITPEEVKQRIGNSNRGKKRSSETRKQMSLSATGNKSNKGHRHTVDARRKIGIAHKGSRNFFWQGGITVINQTIRMSLEYSLWRESVFKRDNFTCVWCGDNTGKNLQADHIKPFAYYPELRFAIDNGRTLCVPCHRKTDTYGVLSKKHKTT
jgi:hypothetical protein